MSTMLTDKLQDAVSEIYNESQKHRAVAERQARALFRRSYPKLYRQILKYGYFEIESCLFPVKYVFNCRDSSLNVELRDGRDICSLCVRVEDAHELPEFDRLLNIAALLSEREEEFLKVANWEGVSGRKAYVYLEKLFRVKER